MGPQINIILWMTWKWKKRSFYERKSSLSQVSLGSDLWPGNTENIFVERSWQAERWRKFQPWRLKIYRTASLIHLLLCVRPFVRQRDTRWERRKTETLNGTNSGWEVTRSKRISSGKCGKCDATVTIRLFVSTNFHLFVRSAGECVR